MGMTDRLQHAWNAFKNNKDPTTPDYSSGGSSIPLDRRPRRISSKTILANISNRIAIDAASMEIKHVRMDDDERYLETIKSGLNECLTISANADQTGRAFVQDAVYSMLDEGVIAIVPVDTTDDPYITGAYDINTLRVGRITEWRAKTVIVDLYNENTGKRSEVPFLKSKISIIQNPFYEVMNEPNSTVKRLSRKMALMDNIDEISGSGKLDLIIQLPYATKSKARQEQAQGRRDNLDRQLASSTYGIAYIDATERITQLNRPLENNLLKQVEYLTAQVFSQIGMTQSILDGTADEKTMLNYINRCVEPILAAIIDEMIRKFLTRTARTQNQSIMMFRDPFKLVPVSQIAEIGDKLTRNEILSSNEVRQAIGKRPSQDPKADALINKNMPTPPDAGLAPQMGETLPYQNDEMTLDDVNAHIADVDAMDKQIDDIEASLPPEKDLKHYTNPYYNPQKAHDYYERTKQLKGRTSTAGLNEEGKAAANTTKAGMMAEKKSLIESARAKQNKEIEAEKTQLQARIASLKNLIGHLTKEQLVEKRSSIMQNIAQLRSDSEGVKAKIRSEFSKTKAGLNSSYDTKYQNELAKIKSNSQFTAKKKASSSGTKKAATESSRGILWTKNVGHT